MIKSAQMRRGHDHVTHYVRELIWEDGPVMAAPTLVAAAVKERWPQQSLDIATLKVSAFPRNWEAVHARLCQMVRAAMVFAPDEVPAWALQFNIPVNTNAEVAETNEPEDVGTADVAPASESKPKKGAIGRAKRRSGGTK
ncbi:MAG: hypothetical protein IPM54_03430 [Polyangiaceae bacterium]|nr:hypothetical protein [Polyangiaceae bacterium]